VQTVTAPDGVTIAYYVWGRRTGTPVLLVQGLGVPAHGWVLQRGAFGRGHRVVAADNRGTGRSDVPFGPYDLLQMADDLVAVLDDAGVERAHVVGASMGGVLAQILGVLHQDRVRSLTLAVTACRHHEWRRELLAEWASEVAGRGMGALSPEALVWLVGPRVRKRFGLWMNVLSRALLQGDARGFVGQVGAILDMSDDLRDELHAIEVPTLVLAGSQDSLTPVGDSEELVELIPGAELVVISGAAHGVMVEAPNAFNRTVLDFIGRVDAAAAAETAAS
jgi:3-oxoadipate enol-lactonase